MIKSMTGFGRCENANDRCKFTVELKSVNHRYLDVNIKMPKKLYMFESAIRSELKKYASRGKVDIYISSEALPGAEDAFVSLDEAYLENYLACLKTLNEKCFGYHHTVRN